jgi:hypothetical protein
MFDVAEAIETAAERHDSVQRATPSPRQIARARSIIQRFLDNCPEDMAVLDLRRAVEDL